MFGVIVRRSLSLQRGAFTDLVFFLVLILSCRGLELVGPSGPIVALIGDDVILPRRLEPAMNAFTTTVEWSRPDLDPRFVFVWRYGLKLESKKHPWFRGRTSVFIEELRHGNVSLRLSKVKLSDGGAYRCFIPTFNKDVTVQLLVGAVSSPVVQVSQSSDGVVLQCESKGWYPEPEMFWLDAEGNLLSSALTETLRGPDGLYTVSSRLTVERRHRNTFTCRVTQRDINHSTEDNTTVPGHFYTVLVPPGSPVVTIFVLVCGALVLVPAVIFAVRKWKQNRLKNRMDHMIMTAQPEEEKTPERGLTEFQVFNKKKATPKKVPLHIRPVNDGSKGIIDETNRVYKRAEGYTEENREIYDGTIGIIDRTKVIYESPKGTTEGIIGITDRTTGTTRGTEGIIDKTKGTTEETKE